MSFYFYLLYTWQVSYLIFTCNTLGEGGSGAPGAVPTHVLRRGWVLELEPRGTGNWTLHCGGCTLACGCSVDWIGRRQAFTVSWGSRGEKKTYISTELYYISCIFHFFQISTVCRLFHNYRIKTITLGNLYYMYMLIMIILVHDCKIFQCMVLSITHASDRSYIEFNMLQNVYYKFRDWFDLLFCRIGNIPVMQRRRQLGKWWVMKFWSFPGGSHEPTLPRNFWVPRGMGQHLTSHPTDITAIELLMNEMIMIFFFIIKTLKK